MDSPTKTPAKTPPTKPGMLGSLTHLLILVVVFIVLAAVAVYIKQHRPTASIAPVTSLSGPSLSLSTKVTKLHGGKTVVVSIWENSGSKNVNAVQANISYPSDKLEFVSNDDANSAFEIQAEADVKNSVITIVRGHKGSLSGKQLVDKIIMQVKGKNGAAALAFTKGTALLDAVTNQDILSQKNGLNFTIEAKK